VVLVRRPSPQRIIYTSVAIPAHHPGARIAATAARRGWSARAAESGHAGRLHRPAERGLARHHRGGL